MRGHWKSGEETLTPLSALSPLTSIRILTERTKQPEEKISSKKLFPAATFQTLWSQLLVSVELAFSIICPSSMTSTRPLILEMSCVNKDTGDWLNKPQKDVEFEEILNNPGICAVGRDVSCACRSPL